MKFLGSCRRGSCGTKDAEQFAFEFDEVAGDRGGKSANGDDAAGSDATDRASQDTANDTARGADRAEPENLRAVFDANPELRSAWQDANAYRDAFPTPEAAREATAVLADVNRMDALFFSRRPEDHAALARAISDLDPAAFASLAQAIADFTRGRGGNAAQAARPEIVRTGTGAGGGLGAGAISIPANRVANGAETAPNGGASAVHEPQVTSHESRNSDHEHRDSRNDSRAANPEAQSEFFHATNASAVEGVVAAIETQVERLLPEGISKSARARVVGEIYRELDANLRSNRQLASQMRDAFRSGSLDAEHQRAIVSLITSRARQALPGVAKRVLNEWTSTLVNANQERRTRQRTAERRVDIAGSSGAGNDGRRSMSPRDLDYSRLSDADILNL